MQPPERSGLKVGRKIAISCLKTGTRLQRRTAHLQQNFEESSEARTITGF